MGAGNPGGGMRSEFFRTEQKMEPFHSLGTEPSRSIPRNSRTEHILSSGTRLLLPRLHS
jgi:hypothetical protein